MVEEKPNILIVDDEPILLEILNEYLDDMNYDVVEANDGKEAWDILQNPKHQFDTVILDRMMPNMDGLEVLKKIKAHPALSKIPVIMQTGSVEKHEILEGLQAGCYYYLTKPFAEDVFTSVVKSAVNDYLNYRSLKEELKKQNQSLLMLDSGSFTLKTLDESRLLTTLLAAAFPEPDKVATGISEILINAIEHGNLGISYSDKSLLLAEQKWESEIEKRLKQPQFKNRYVSVEFKRSNTEISIEIIDQGDGFEWQQYMEISPERSGDSHGRGIAMANLLSFDNLEYKGKGNHVKVTLNISSAFEDDDPKLKTIAN